MNAIIIDDEPDCVSVMNTLLIRHCPEVQVTGMYTDAAMSVARVQADPPDILFLDIEMPRMNGFQLLDQLKDLPFFLIFTTAYNEFAVKAFKYSALDYLLKPIDPLELVQAVKKVETKIQLDRSQLELLQKQLHQTGPRFQNQIALPHQNGYTIVETRTILYCQSDSCYTRFFLENGEVYLITKSLGDVEDTLSNDDFYRIHKQYLINLRHVTRYGRGEGGFVIMRDGKNLAIARSRREIFKKIFLHI